MTNVGIIVDNDLNSDIRVIREINILNKKDFNIHVLCFGFDNKYYPPLEDINIYRIEIYKIIKDILFFLFNRVPLYELIWKINIKKFINSNSIDILHVHDLYMSKASYKAIKSTNKEIPLILDLHENFPYAIQSYNWTKGIIRKYISNPKAWVKKESEYLNYATKIIVLSESYKQLLLQRYVSLNEVDVIPFPNVIDIKQFEKYKVSSDVHKNEKITMMYFGAVAERRGIFDTLEVLKICLDNNLNIELLIIGPVDKSDKKKFLREINSNKLKENITYIPWIDISELVSYMHISDIFLSPLLKNEQHESGVANKIFQYMYAGKPIIVSDCKPQKELVETFNCGLSYSTKKEFVDCITRLAKDKKLREKLGSHGYRYLYENFDNKKYNKILLDIYHNINFTS